MSETLVAGEGVVDRSDEDARPLVVIDLDPESFTLRGAETQVTLFCQGVRKYEAWKQGVEVCKPIDASRWYSTLGWYSGGFAVADCLAAQFGERVANHQFMYPQDMSNVQFRIGESIYGIIENQAKLILTARLNDENDEKVLFAPMLYSKIVGESISNVRASRHEDFVRLAHDFALI